MNGRSSPERRSQIARPDLIYTVGGATRGPSLVSVLAVAGSLIAGPSCYSYRVAPTPVPQQAVVRLRFDPPRPLVVVSRGGDTLRMDGVTSLDGRVLNARGDTLNLELAVVRSGNVSLPGVGGSRTTVVPDRGRPAELRRVSQGAKAVALLAGTAGVTVALLVLYILTVYG
jgi:hypothetical protein